MPLIILDRDGVVNEDSDAYIKSVEEWKPIPGSIEAIARLTANNFKVVIASNQSGLSRRYFDTETLYEMHNKLHQLVAHANGEIHGIFVCPHGPNDHCECRKPAAELFIRIANTYDVSFNACFAIGDSLRDLEAAETVGAKPVLVKTGKGESTLKHNSAFLADRNIPVFRDLADAVENIISTNTS